jgi:hypothetical protein
MKKKMENKHIICGDGIFLPWLYVERENSSERPKLWVPIYFYELLHRFY